MRTKLIIFIFLMLSLTFFEAENTRLIKADTLGMPAHSTINILSPQNSTYYVNNLVLNLSVVEDHLGNSVKYSMDGGDLQDVAHFKIVLEEPISEESFGQQYNLTQYTIICDQAFNNLTYGNHSLSVYNGYVDSLYGHFYENSEANISFKIQNLPTTSTPSPTVPEFPTSILIVTFLLTTTLLVAVMIKRKQSIG